MSSVRKVESIGEANSLIGKETLHPMVTVIDFSKYGELDYIKMNIGFYGVFLKTAKDVNLYYGRQKYDYHEGTLIFIGPGQVVGFSEEKLGKKFKPTGWALMFHPDLLQGASLNRKIHDYTFFSYDVHEALHLSEQEKQIVIDCFKKIDYELSRGIDKHSKTLILSNIELFLNYCVRFYDRQFITRDNVNRDVLTKFESILDNYFANDMPNTEGLPTVAYCAGQLNLSPNYFGDLIKKETGKSAQEYIQTKLISVAKERISEGNRSMSEIAYELGFKYPQHFTRLFKQKVGVTPHQYRNEN